MNSSILEHKREYEVKRRRKKFWKSIVTALSCAVVFCTTYALILPAITMENRAYCGYEEHAHGEGCYTLQLTCTQTDEVIEGHEHESDCFEQKKTLICEIPEITAHVHSSECECVEVVVGCELEESEEHTHTEECNTEQVSYICALEETKDIIEEMPASSTFALRNTADAYAPEGVSLTGVWSEDLITIANSQIGYSEVNGLSKYDQWAGNYGTNYWNVNFVNYCLHYAGVDSDSIPWDTSYDFSQWISALEEKGLYKAYDANQMKPGDIVFVQGWNAGQNYNVGVCVEASGGAFYIVFGDMDVNGRVVKEQFWENWTGRLLGYVSLSDSLETSVDGILTASVGYNGGVLPQGTDLVVELIKDQESYRNLIETNLKPTGSQILEDYYLDIYFTKEGQIIYPNESLNVKIDFTTPLTADSSAVESGGDVQWIYGLIADGIISEAMELVQTELESNGCIKKAVVSYEPNAIYAFASVQETKIQLTAETMAGETKATATVVGNVTVFSEDMQMEIRFIEENTADWISKIEETYVNEKELVSVNRFFEVIFKDADGNPVDIPERVKITVSVTFDPPVSAAFSDGSNARTGNWKLNTIETISGNIKLEEVDAKITTAKSISLESVTFNDYKAQPYVLSAVVVNPAYTETVVDYYELSEVLKNGESIAQIKLGADITIPSNGGFIIESGKQIFLDLNGYDIITDGTLFTIKEGAEVSVSDSKAVAETTEDVGQLNLRADEDGDSAAQLAANKANVGMPASYDSANEELAYYVTKTEITDSTVGATKETLVKHTVELQGNIKGGSEVAIKVDGGTFYMESGAITGCLNTAILQTGGTLNLSGGYICNNHKVSGDGGAIYINGKEFVLNSGVISGNFAETSGGGVYCTGTTNVEIAGGYGGGVAGCSTGRAFVYQEDGGAIYGNTAVDRNSGNPHVSGGESTKAEDHLYPTSVFRENGYEDYFCAFNSIISGTMLGGGSANWTGTVDGIPVTIAKDEDVASTYLMGLVSNPAASDIQKVQENARVYVNGNDSYTHGGGVLGNGYLVIGTTESLEVYARLKVEASKEMTGADLENGQFRFIIEDMHNGFLMAKGTNTADGDIIFDHLIPFTEEGTYEYLIYEDRTSENGDKVLKSAWWPLKNVYVGNVRICFGVDDANSMDMVVFENNKFDAVDYNRWNSNAAKLYTRTTASAESQTVFTITNTKVEEETVTYKINITKVSAENREVLLSGAKFALYHADEHGEADMSRQIVFAKDGQGVYRYLTAKGSTDVLPTDIYEAITVRGGKLIFTELPKGNYVLVEVEAPNGYLVIEPMLITVGEDSVQEKTYPITIEDQIYQEAYELPDTGGTGTVVYTAGGILLMMISALLYMERKNRRKGGIDST